MNSLSKSLPEQTPPDSNIGFLKQLVLDLQIVEGLFSAVERKFLIVNKAPFEVKQVKNSLLELQELRESGSARELERSIQLFEELLETWKANLIKRDDEIETQQIRRFCDEFKRPFDLKVFKALTRFYRTVPHTLSTQSKYDFAVTRSFLKTGSNNLRETSFERETIVRQLNNFSEEWNLLPGNTSGANEKVIQIITKLDEFICESEFITSFEELVQSQLFEKLREFKSQMGEIFYHPSVTASAIECNVFVGNIFAELLAQENEKLSRIIANKFDFASVLHDTSPTALSNSGQMLENIRTDSLNQEINPDEDSTYIWEWLQTVCSSKAETRTIVETVEFEEVPQPARQRLSQIFDIILTPNSDKSLLSDYLQSSQSLKNIDFGIFLSSATEESDRELFQKVFMATLWAEEIRSHELMKNGKLSDETTNEISLILAELQSLSIILKARIDELESDVTHNLLYVSNQLLESRLKLERAIVRYSKQNLETSETVETAEPQTEFPKTTDLKRPEFQVNRWILAVSVIMLILSFGAYLSVRFFESGAKVANDIERLETIKLPGNQNFVDAQRVRDTLYLTAKESWKAIPESDQRILLKEILNHPTKTPLVTVIIMDRSGLEIATASPESIETTAQLLQPSDQ